jgi:TatD DNase family protein
MFDTHAHINFKAFEADATEVVQRAFNNGVSLVLVGTQIDTSREAVELAKKFNSPAFGTPSLAKEGGGGVYAVVGLHPVHTYSQHLDEEETSFQTREEIFDYEAYYKLASHPLVVGIGECGLDYFRLPAEISQESTGVSHEQIKKQQQAVFLQQIKLAKALNKALVIHCRPSAGTADAYLDILEIVDTEHLALSTNHSSFRFEIHSFTGSPEIAMEFVKRGAYVGLNGIITFGDRKTKNMTTSSIALAKEGDKTGNMKKVVETVPLERIVLETDSPYLTPIPHRGKRNEPSFVKFVAEKVAEIKGISLEEVEKTTTQNAKLLFKI